MVGGLLGRNDMSICIIAEIGVNHNGSVQLAKEMVSQAKACGADMVKFQTFSADRLAALSTPKVPYQLRTSDPNETHHAMLKKLELSQHAHFEIKIFCETLKIEFLSTPYSREDAEFLFGLGVNTFKVASADIVDRSLHEYIAGTGKGCLLATGMATMEEIAETIAIYKQHQTKDHLVLLQCVSAYPANPADANLRFMKTLQEQFNCRTGYSDHTNGIECAIASAALGATVIEKHFTLDRSLPGPDHAASSIPSEFSAMVQAVRIVENAIGDGIKRICLNEEKMRAVSRKSIVAARNLSSGHVLKKDDLTFRRPGTGISPMRYADFIGRMLVKPLLPGEQIYLDHVQG